MVYVCRERAVGGERGWRGENRPTRGSGVQKDRTSALQPLTLLKDLLLMTLRKGLASKVP